MRKFGMNDEAFTGLEAAIVLIAFVVVAAVFSYVMLGAGFFTSQKSQEVVHTSVAQASSSMDVAGSVVGVGSATTTGYLGDVIFYLQLTSGGSPADISKTAYAISTKDEMEIVSYTDTSKVAVELNTKGDGDNLLEKDEIMKVTLHLATIGVDVGTNDKFTIDVKPSVGAALPIVKHAPAGIEKSKYYELN
jgi:flagellin FlaB